MKPKPMPEITISDQIRFWNFVAVGQPDDCWNWIGCLGGAPNNPCRYGQFYLKRAQHKAHRVSWKISYGQEPKDRILHRCDNPKCVNPKHLFEGSLLDNALDRKAKGRGAVGDKNGSRTHPEKLTRGIHHWSRHSPEKLCRGPRHWCCNPARKPKGEDMAWAKLTENDVLDIRSIASYGASKRDLSSAYGVTFENVSMIVRRKTWTHL